MVFWTMKLFISLSEYLVGIAQWAVYRNIIYRNIVGHGGMWTTSGLTNVLQVE